MFSNLSNVQNTPVIGIKSPLWNYSNLQDATLSMPKRDDVRTKKILVQPSPYADLIEHLVTPSEEELLNSCSLLALCPEWKRKSYAVEIAQDEYSHYVCQTYYFEVLGFQILSSIVIQSKDFSLIHQAAAQAIDEARHIELYAKLLDNLRCKSQPASCMPALYKYAVDQGNVNEKIIRGMVVLESIAIGLFSARATAYATAPISKIDRQVLSEESNHQNDAVQILARVIREGDIQIDDVVEIMRETVDKLTFDILPLNVATRHNLPLSEEQIGTLRHRGILAKQTHVSRMNLIHLLKRVRRTIPGARASDTL